MKRPEGKPDVTGVVLPTGNQGSVLLVALSAKIELLALAAKVILVPAGIVCCQSSSVQGVFAAPVSTTFEAIVPLEA
jgi:hypothetical protein